MISEEKIAEVRQAAKISDFVSPYVPLKRQGRSLMGLCPFHAEKTPSFSVNDEAGFFHCFGCSEGGNVFKFLMRIENLGFPEAVRKVAERYGIPVPDQGAHTGWREAAFVANASAARYFQRCLKETPPGRRVLEYLCKRGISESSVETFALGASPLSADGLLRWFSRDAVDLVLVEKLGLLARRAGGLQDRFRGRLMFPIRDAQGRVLGFGARAIEEGAVPKYLNSPDSEVYHKSRVLYGLYEGREALRAADRVIVVEGYLDLIALHAAGIGNVVASCGTAFTAEQARSIRRYASEVVTLFDGDDAGAHAAARSFPVFIEAGVWATTVCLPDGEDPDSYLRRLGREAMEQKIATAKPLAEAYVRHVVESVPKGTSGMAKAGAELASVLAKLRDPFEYDLLVRKAALWTGISEQVLRRKGRLRGRTSELSATQRGKGGAPGPAELLVSIMLLDREAIAYVDQSGVMNSMDETIWKRLIGDMIERERHGHIVDTGKIMEQVPGELRSRVAARLLEDGFAEKKLRQRALEDCIKGVERKARRRHNRFVATELKKLAEQGVEQAPAEQLAKWRPRQRSDA